MSFPASALQVRPLIETRGVTRVIGGDIPTTLVAGIDFAVQPGEFVAVTGPSGSGKSSLLYLLGLLDKPTTGEVYVEGKATSGLNEDARAALRLSSLGFVFQFHFLLPEFTAMDNVMLPMRALGNSATKRCKRVRWIFSPHWALPITRANARTRCRAGSVSASPSPARSPMIRW